MHEVHRLDRALHVCSMFYYYYFHFAVEKAFAFIVCLIPRRICCGYVKRDYIRSIIFVVLHYIERTNLYDDYDRLPASQH